MVCRIKIPLHPAASSTRCRAWLLDPCVLRETFRLHSFVFRALSRCSLSPSIHSLSFHFTHFHILFPQVLLRFSPSYCPLMSPPPLWFPFCPSKCCHQTPFIIYFSVQDTLLSQGNRKNNIIRKILRKEKKNLYKSLNVTVFSFALEILPPAGALSSFPLLQSVLRGQDPSLLCQ